MIILFMLDLIMVPVMHQKYTHVVVQEEVEPEEETPADGE